LMYDIIDIYKLSIFMYDIIKEVES